MKRRPLGCCLSVVHYLLFSLGMLPSSSSGAEEPAYSVELRDGSFELRAYPEQVLAETIVEGSLEEAGNKAFRVLFAYISGDNRSGTKIEMTAPVGQEERAGEKIAMTAPVTVSAAGNRWAVTFMMPSGYRIETLPEPLDERVRLRVAAPARMAAVRYSGRWTRKGYESNLARLREWMLKQQLEAAGEPIWARYNPPFMPWFLRRNEVLIPLVTKSESIMTGPDDE